MSALRLPWIEKYRPSTFDAIVGNVANVNRLNAIASSGNMPHLILSGPPGTGKTSSMHVLARALLGPDVKRAVLELNASDDRGIAVVRQQIKGFATSRVRLPTGRHKIVILDEADNMTAAAQHALRRTIEQHSDNTRFVFACNQSTKIIEAIQSRCSVVRFERLSDDQAAARLREVAASENLKLDDEACGLIIFHADGDMRVAINQLQASAALASVDREISAETVSRVTDQPHPRIVESILEACFSKNFTLAESTLRVELLRLGYHVLDIYGSIFKVLKGSTTIDERLKLAAIQAVGFAHKRALEGLTSWLQCASLIAKLVQLAFEAQAPNRTNEPCQTLRR